MLVDYEKVLLKLKAAITEKPSHGQKDLLALISQLEGENVLDEGLYEKSLRIYGAFVTDALTRPSLGSPRVVSLDGPDDRPERRSGSATSEEDSNARRHAGNGAARA